MTAYIDPAEVTKLRIFHEPDPIGGRWYLDGIDHRRPGWPNFTEACWTFDTWREAIGAMREFAMMLLGAPPPPLPPPNEADALTFDEVEAAGLDGTLRGLRWDR